MNITIDDVNNKVPSFNEDTLLPASIIENVGPFRATLLEPSCAVRVTVGIRGQPMSGSIENKLSVFFSCLSALLDLYLTLTISLGGSGY